MPNVPQRAPNVPSPGGDRALDPSEGDLRLVRRDANARTIVAMRTTDPLRREHAELLPHIEDIRITAEVADVLAPEAFASELDDVLGFLRHHLVPHARAEDAALYPVVDRVLGAPGATATMTRDHVEVVGLVDELAGLRDALVASGSTPERICAVQRVLYGLYAVIRLHFAKEEEVYLPLLDAALTPAEADEMFERMELAATV